MRLFNFFIVFLQQSAVVGQSHLHCGQVSVHFRQMLLLPVDGFLHFLQVLPQIFNVLFGNRDFSVALLRHIPVYSQKHEKAQSHATSRFAYTPAPFSLHLMVHSAAHNHFSVHFRSFLKNFVAFHKFLMPSDIFPAKLRFPKALRPRRPPETAAREAL